MLQNETLKTLAENWEISMRTIRKLVYLDIPFTEKKYNRLCNNTSKALNKFLQNLNPLEKDGLSGELKKFNDQISVDENEIKDILSKILQKKG